jgi:hypothetical protein
LDGTGKIRYTEFLAATIEAQGAISEERLAEAFDRLDCDDSGYISAENLADILGKDFPREEIDEIIQEADLTKDMKISYSEFLALWESKHEHERSQQLKVLGETNHLYHSSDVDMNSFRGSNLNLADEPLEPAEGRADFILEKHDSSRRVVFTDTVVAISQNNVVEQAVLDD